MSETIPSSSAAAAATVTSAPAATANKSSTMPVTDSAATAADAASPISTRNDKQSQSHTQNQRPPNDDHTYNLKTIQSPMPRNVAATKLVPDVFRFIFTQFADTHELIAAANVCRAWRSMLDHPLVWNAFCKHHGWPGHGRSWFLQHLNETSIYRSAPLKSTLIKPSNPSTTSALVSIIHGATASGATASGGHGHGAGLLHDERGAAAAAQQRRDNAAAAAAAAVGQQGIVTLFAPKPQRMYDWTTGSYRNVNSGIVVSVGTAPGYLVRVVDVSNVQRPIIRRAFCLGDEAGQEKVRYSCVHVDAECIFFASMSAPTLHVITLAVNAVKDRHSMGGGAEGKAPPTENETGTVAASSATLTQSGGRRGAKLKSSGGIPIMPSRSVGGTRRRRPYEDDNQHSSAITCVKARNMVGVSGAYDHTVRVWDLSTGSMLASYRDGHTSPVWSVTIDHTCGRIASGANDGEIYVWNVSANAVVTGAALGPGGVGGGDVPVTDSRCVAQLHGHERTVMALSFDDWDDNVLISAGYDRVIRIWNISEGLCSRILKGHTDCVFTLLVTQHTLCSGSRDCTIRVWDRHYDAVRAASALDQRKRGTAVHLFADNRRPHAEEGTETTAAAGGAVGAGGVMPAMLGEEKKDGNENMCLRVLQLPQGSLRGEAPKGLAVMPYAAGAESQDCLTLVAGGMMEGLRLWRFGDSFQGPTRRAGYFDVYSKVWKRGQENCVIQ